MPKFPKRYLLNTNTNEVHDTENYQTSCMIYSMKPEHQMFFDTLNEALKYSHNNDGCAYCLPNVHTK